MIGQRSVRGWFGRDGLRPAWVDDDTIQVGAGACSFLGGGVFQLATAANYTFASLDTGARALGRDYSVHATPDGIKLHLIPVDNSGLGALYPSGYTAATSRLLGYFHNGPKADGTVGAGRNQGIFRYSITSNDLLNGSYPYRAPQDLAAGVPLPGMIRVGATALGIYIASREDATASAVGTSSYPTSRYGMVPWHSLSGWASMMVARHVGCRLPTWEEWLGAVEFSPGSITPALVNGNTYYGSASDDAYLVAPGALTSALAGLGAGLLSNGVYKYRVTFVNATGETQGGTANAGTTVADYTADGQIALTAIPVGAAGTTARKLYRTLAGGATYKLLDTIADNSTTIYTDNIADGSLGATVAERNTTGAQQGENDPTHNAGRTLVGTGPRTTQFVTAAGRSWYAPSGLADPVGNIWKWVAQFFGGLKTASPGTGVAWGYNGDYAYNFQGQAYNPDTGGWTEGLPALLIVGGDWSSGAGAGVRTAVASYSAGSADSAVGFSLAR